MRCRYCGAPLPDPEPVGPTSQVECACGYITLVETGEVELPIGQVIVGIAPERNDLLVDTDDPDRCTTVFLEAFRLVVDRAHAIVAGNVEAARHAVWRYLLEFERTSLAHRRGDASQSARLLSVPRATQLLVGSLFTLDETSAAPDDRAAVDLGRFVPAHTAVAMEVLTLAATVDNLRNGLLEGRIASGTLYARKTPLHTGLAEWMINKNRSAKPGSVDWQRDEIFSGPSDEAQTAWLGFSPDLGRRLFAQRHLQLREMAAATDLSLYYIPRERCSRDVVPLFEALSLKPERVHQFSVPFYWDLGLREATGDSGECLRRLARYNWFNYYPVVPCASDEEGPGYLVAAEALMYAMANLELFKGRLLERVYTAAQSSQTVTKAVVRRIAKLRSLANRKFEDVAARVAAQAGFAAAVSVETCGGAKLAAGEIDLLFAHEAGGTLVVGVAEIKDFDVTLHRLHTLRSLHEKVRSADAQLAAKALEVQRAWPQLLRELPGGPTGTPRDVLVAAVLVTSTQLPAFVFGEYPVVALDALPAFLRQLRDDRQSLPERFWTRGIVRV